MLLNPLLWSITIFSHFLWFWTINHMLITFISGPCPISNDLINNLSYRLTILLIIYFYNILIIDFLLKNIIFLSINIQISYLWIWFFYFILNNIIINFLQSRRNINKLCLWLNPVFANETCSSIQLIIRILQRILIFLKLCGII